MEHHLIENALSGNITQETSDKYLQDSFETEKSKPNRISPNVGDIQSQSNAPRRRSSIRFYEENPSIGNISKQITEHNPIILPDATEYGKDGYDQYIPNEMQSQQQQDPTHTKLDYTTQSHYDEPSNIYETENYDTTQYVNPQIYDGHQYRTDTQQSNNDYNYQDGYQDYEASNYDGTGYQPNEQSSNALYLPEQYSDEIYRDEISKPMPDHGINQTIQQPTAYMESSNTSMDQLYKGNGNTTNTTAHRLQSTPKQPIKKKST